MTWFELDERHHSTLLRCCTSASGRAQVDDDLAAPLVELGLLAPAGYGYAPTPRGYRFGEVLRRRPEPYAC